MLQMFAIMYESEEIKRIQTLYEMLFGILGEPYAHIQKMYASHVYKSLPEPTELRLMKLENKSKSH
jgi:hypothetical protein